MLLWLGLTGSAAAQILVPTHLSTALSKPSAKVGEEVDLIINARIDDKWHLYSSDFSDEVGPVVFTLKFKPSPAYKVVGKLQAIKSHHEQDDVFKGEVAFWEKTGQMRQRIKLLQPGPLTISADADYQSCTTVDGKCVPGNETLKFGPLAVAGAPTPAKAVGAVPPTPSPAKETATSRSRCSQRGCQRHHHRYCRAQSPRCSRHAGRTRSRLHRPPKRPPECPRLR